MSDSPIPLPPPTFEFMVFSLKTQAEMRLGLLAFGEEEFATVIAVRQHETAGLPAEFERLRNDIHCVQALSRNYAAKANAAAAA